MAVNDIIRQAEYNDIRNKVIGVLGTGSGTSGYGQTLNSSAVAAGNRVTINEWSNLRFDIINAHVHQNGTPPSVVTVTEGGRIRFSAVDAPVTTYDAIANNLITNRFLAHPSQMSTNVPTPSSTSTAWPGPFGNTWNTRIACNINISWPTANQARHFFNTGGQVRITSTRTATTLTTQQANNWTTVLNNANAKTPQFGGNNPGTGTSPADGQNWYRLTNAFQTYFSEPGTSFYTVNRYNLRARVTDVANNSSGTARSAQFQVEFVDTYLDPGPPAPGDAVDGNFTVSVSFLFATGVLVPSGFGNFAVTLPTVSFGTIGP